ncbi:hypothetical protein [Kineococcus sp. R86509]|uniref:hypothetical protein n=1 Tax=Kineococcus sp. R86509 TaxID=3093851 RepID=UPI0036D23E36
MTSTVTITVTGVGDAHDLDHVLAAITTAAHSGDASGTSNWDALHWTWDTTPEVQCIDCHEQISTTPSPEGRCASCHAENGPCAACALGEHDWDVDNRGHCDCCGAALPPAQETDVPVPDDPGSTGDDDPDSTGNDDLGPTDAEPDPHELVVTDPDRYLGADLFSLDVLVQLLHQDHDLPSAYVWQSGGGCATVHVGDVVRDYEAIKRWTCVAGPGTYGWGAKPSTATLAEFYVGPESGDGEMGCTDANAAGCRTLRDVAALTAAQARTSWGELTDASTLDALGLDSSLRSGLPEVLAEQARSRGCAEAANAALHAAYAAGASVAEAGRASREAADAYLANHPAPTNH